MSTKFLSPEQLEALRPVEGRRGSVPKPVQFALDIKGMSVGQTLQSPFTGPSGNQSTKNNTQVIAAALGYSLDVNEFENDEGDSVITVTRRA